MSNKKKKQNDNRSLLVQWGIPVVLLVVVIIFLISNFTITSLNSAEETIGKQLSTEIEVYGVTLKNDLAVTAGAARGAASVISADIASGHDSDIGEYISRLSDSSQEAYMVAYADQTGAAVLSNGEKTDLSDASYFASEPVEGYIYVPDNAIDGTSSFVFTAPVRAGDETYGVLYMYVRPDDIITQLSVGNYGGVTYAIISSSGDVLVSEGSSSELLEGGNVFNAFSKAKLTKLTEAQIRLRIEKKTRMIFGAEKNGESRTVVIAPIGVADWQLMAIIKQEYVETVVDNEMQNPRSMIIKLAIAILAFLAFLVTNSIFNKIKYGEQSKDLEDKADTDLLTGLNNKIAAERKIQEYMTENPDSQCLMFLFDIDNFKKINDTMGHAFGDEVLQTLGHQLSNEFRVTDIIGRLGGDEFVLFLKNIKSDEQLEREGIRIANFFHQFKAGGYVKYSATASIGGVVFPRDAKDFQSAYKAADVALYEAKRRGKNQLIFYSKDIADVESVRVSDAVEPIADYREELEKKKKQGN